MRYIIAILLLSFSAAAREKNDLANMRMRGHVKQFTCTLYMISDSAGITNEQLRTGSLFYFSKAGNATEVYYYNSKGVVSSSIKYKYNAKNQHVETLEYTGDTLVKKRVYVYKNNVKTETKDYTGESKLIQRQTFTPDGTGEKRFTYDSTGKMLFSEVYVCDANDNVLSHTTHGDHWMDIKEEQTFDRRGYMTSQSTFAGSRDGRYILQKKEDIVSDSLGNETGRTAVFNLRGKEFSPASVSYTYTYDKTGNTLTKKEMAQDPQNKAPRQFIRCEYVYY